MEVLSSPDWAPSPAQMHTGLILDNFTRVSGFAERLETNAPKRRALAPSPTPRACDEAEAIDLTSSLSLKAVAAPATKEP